MKDSEQVVTMHVACMVLTATENDLIGRAVSERPGAYKAALSAELLGKRVDGQMFAETALRCAKLVLANKGEA